MLVEVEGVADNFVISDPVSGPVEIVVGVVDMFLPVGELWTGGVVTCCVNLLIKEIGGTEENVEVVAGPLDMLVIVDKLYTEDAVVDGTCMLVDDILVAVNVKDCVVMLVVLEEFWTIGDLVVDVLKPIESNGVGVVDMLLPVKEIWTVGVVTFCVSLIAEEIEDVAENVVADVVVVADLLILVEELCNVEVVVIGICTLVDDIFVAAVVKDGGIIIVVLEEFWTAVIFVCGVVMPCEIDGEDIAVVIIVKAVGMLIPVGELWTAGLVTCVNLLVENVEGVAENVEVVPVVVDMLSLGVGMLAEKVGEGVALEMVDRSVSMFVTVEELWMVDVVFAGICILADDIVVTAVVEECVVMLPQFSSQHNTLIS